MPFVRPDMVMIGPHFSAALVAKDCGDQGPGPDRRFDFVITHDRELVVRAAQPLLAKLARSERRLLAVRREPCQPRLGIRARVWLEMTSEAEVTSNLPRLVAALREPPSPTR